MPDLFGDDTPEYEGLTRSAAISACGCYRWWLRRSWQRGGNGKLVSWIMLNPSTADATVDDPTIRRVMVFTRAWGYSWLDVRNLFPLRATDPAELLTAPGKGIDPTGGQDGDAYLSQAACADLIVCAWGASVPFGRDRRAIELLRGKPLFCLGTTKDGQPRHPLYVRSDQLPELYLPKE